VPMEFITQNILLITLVVFSGMGLLWPMVMRRRCQRGQSGEATLLINREDAHVIDVREAEEFASGHLPEAKNVPLSPSCPTASPKSRNSRTSRSSCAALPACALPRPVANSASWVLPKVHNLAGGVDAWVGAGYPVKKGTRNK
jgi:hypothetical protein